MDEALRMCPVWQNLQQHLQPEGHTSASTGEALQCSECVVELLQKLQPDPASASTWRRSRYKCPNCEQSFRHADLLTHQQDHLGGGPFPLRPLWQELDQSAAPQPCTTGPTWGPRPCICCRCRKSFSSSSSWRAPPHPHGRRPSSAPGCGPSRHLQPGAPAGPQGESPTPVHRCGSTSPAAPTSSATRKHTWGSRPGESPAEAGEARLGDGGPSLAQKGL